MCLCLFVDRDPNVSTHIRIAAVLWDETIKGLCVCAHVCVFLFNGLAPEQGRDPKVSAHFRVAARICLEFVLT